MYNYSQYSCIFTQDSLSYMHIYRSYISTINKCLLYWSPTPVNKSCGQQNISLLKELKLQEESNSIVRGGG